MCRVYMKSKYKLGLHLEPPLPCASSRTSAPQAITTAPPQSTAPRPANRVASPPLRQRRARRPPALLQACFGILSSYGRDSFKFRKSDPRCHFKGPICSAFQQSSLFFMGQWEAALLDCCLENEFVAFSAASDGSIHRYDMHSGHKSAIGNHDDMATFVEYSPETCQLVTTGWDKNIIFWDAQSAKSVGRLNNLTSEPESMSLSGFNLMVAIDSSVIIYDFRSLRKSVHTKDVRIKCVRPILRYEGFVVGSVDGRVALEYICESNLDKGYAFRCHPKGKDGRHRVESVNDIAFSPLNTGSFVTGDNEGYVIMWDACYKKRLFEFSRYPNSIASLSYNHDGFLLAVASSYTYQEAGEREELPQIFIHKVQNIQSESPSVGAS
ncbi:mitotic checkpoint protein BUB3.3-like isoform X3 [Ipomoea triloba]|uniref:mitotic checkpoint protein BUB3.3-like isoform X3 n=1 Tax=Ipomoea triloba TaxID=35885 RepID=UPI00125CE011|nr:mitotic checkpoint protein BUB3.3-like isoform X3 [Ipomoea triloba]